MLLNNAKEIEIEPGFSILIHQNDTLENKRLTKEIDCSFIQLHFSLQQNAKLFFNQGRYSVDVTNGKSMLLYNPLQDLPMDIEIVPQAKMVSVLISIEKLHTFFTPEAGIIHFLSEDNKSKKYYADKNISPNESVVLSQIISHNVQASMEKLYLKAKIYELLSLYFQPKEDATNNCPFLEQEENVEKIRKAKQLF